MRLDSHVGRGHGRYGPLLLSRTGKAKRPKRIRSGLYLILIRCLVPSTALSSCSDADCVTLSSIGGYEATISRPLSWGFYESICQRTSSIRMLRAGISYLLRFPLISYKVAELPSTAAKQPPNNT